MRKERVFEAEKVVRQKKYMFAVEKSCSPLTLGNWSGLVAAGPQPSAMIGFTNSMWWFLNTTQSLLVIRSMFLALWSTWQKPRGDGRKKGNLSSEPEWIHPTWSAAHCTSFDFEKPERHFPREREVSTSNQMFLSGLLAVWKNLVITGPLEKFAGYLVENEGVLAEDRVWLLWTICWVKLDHATSWHSRGEFFSVQRLHGFRP